MPIYVRKTSHNLDAKFLVYILNLRSSLENTHRSALFERYHLEGHEL